MRVKKKWKFPRGGGRVFTNPFGMEGLGGGVKMKKPSVGGMEIC